MNLAHTIASADGRATIWQCMSDGCLIYTPDSTDQPAACPHPNHVDIDGQQWTRQSPPVGPFRP